MVNVCLSACVSHLGLVLLTDTLHRTYITRTLHVCHTYIAYTSPYDVCMSYIRRTYIGPTEERPWSDRGHPSVGPRDDSGRTKGPVMGTNSANGAAPWALFIRHCLSATYNSQSNGSAEKGVGQKKKCAGEVLQW